MASQSQITMVPSRSDGSVSAAAVILAIIDAAMLIHNITLTYFLFIYASPFLRQQSAPCFSVCFNRSAAMQPSTISSFNLPKCVFYIRIFFWGHLCFPSFLPSFLSFCSPIFHGNICLFTVLSSFYYIFCAFSSVSCDKSIILCSPFRVNITTISKYTNLR